MYRLALQSLPSSCILIIIIINVGGNGLHINSLRHIYRFTIDSTYMENILPIAMILLSEVTIEVL